MISRRKCFLGIIGWLAPLRLSCMQEPDSVWEKKVDRLLYEFVACRTPIDDRSPCNFFLARAVKTVYGIDDFFKRESPETPMSANEIGLFVRQSNDWTGLGAGDSQYSLTQAEGYSNLKKAVIAVYSAEPNGHVALILPGSLTYSDKWNLKVPNSASFFLDEPNKSYIGKPLSSAFGPDKKAAVKIFGRNF